MRIFLLSFCIVLSAESQMLQLPTRSISAPAGSQFYSIIASLPRQEREDTLFAHISAGNIPDFLRKLVPVTMSRKIKGTDYVLKYFVTPDYLAVGDDEDYFLMPMTPILAQKIADLTSCILPTARMADQIYAEAVVKLPPQPIPPDARMDKVPRFYQHNDSVKSLRNALRNKFPAGSLVAGTKKDVIIDARIYSLNKPSVPRPVVIYGWHRPNGVPIQPVYNGHGETYADYSHGIRLIQRRASMNGAEISVTDILQDPDFSLMISDTILVYPFYRRAE